MSIEQPQNQNEREFKVVDGKKYEKVPSGYTVRQYFSHETEEMGPGPGWDSWAFGRKEICEEYGLDTANNKWLRLNPSDLPDTPYYVWRRVEEE